MDRVEEIAPWECANSFQKWTFSIINSTLLKGMQRTLEFSDLMDIPRKDKAHILKDRLKELYFDGLKKKHWIAKCFPFIPHLLISLLRLVWLEGLLVTFYTILEALIRISLPLILIFLLRSLEAQNINEAYMWAGILSIVSLSQTLVHHVLFFFSMRAGWNWKTATTALIYEGLFELQYGGAMASTMTGRMMNLISNDVQRFEEFAVFACFSWEAFLEVAVILLVLIYILDVPSAIAGVGCTFLFIPLMTYLARFFAKYRSLTAQSTDQRIRYIGEVIEGMMSVKSYTWEKPFYLYISKLRLKEMQFIAKSQFLRSINQALMFCTPAIVSFVTFVVYWALGGELTVPKVFSTISLLQVLRMTIGRQWTRSIETGSEAVASSQRIENFLSTAYPESLPAANMRTGKHAESPSLSGVSNKEISIKPILGIKNGCYYYGEDISSPTLTNISFELSAGELLMVVGPVGSGKSSLLSAILGEMKSVLCDAYEFYLKPQTKLAYSAQSPFILAASVKANIVLTRSTADDDLTKPLNVDEFLYEKTVECCNIVDDLLQWPAYDDTEIGERGVSVSGGQKARISLARAVYSDADLYILDDPLSAVDAHVGRSIMHNCIEDHLLGRNKAVILVTHQLQYLHCASRIIALNKQGQQIFCGTHGELKKNKEVIHLLQGEKKYSKKQNGRDEDEVDADVELFLDDPNIEEDNQAGREQKAELVRSSTYHAGTYRMKSTVLEDLNPTKTSSKNSYKSVMKIKSEKAQLLEANQENGEAKKKSDADLGDLWFGITVLTLILASQVLLMITDYWVNWWAVTKYYSSQSNSSYVINFAILVFLCIVIGFIRAHAFFAYTRQCANNLHHNCLFAVLHSPLLFFNSNPTGRILNRFTKDQNHADESLPVLYFSFLESFIYCISGVILVCISLPYLILLLPFLIYFFTVLRNKYLCTTREVKRLEALKRSEQFTHFQATLQGLMTFRSYNMKDQCKTAFVRILNDYGKIYWTFLMSSRWLGFRLDMETNIILIAVCFVAVAASKQVGNGNVSLVGFTLTYIIQLSGLFQWTVRQSAEIETQMVSVERIYTYSQLRPEPGYIETIEDVNNYNLGIYEDRSDSIVTLCKQYHIAVSSKAPSDTASKDELVDDSSKAESGEYYNNQWIDRYSNYMRVLSQDGTTTTERSSSNSHQNALPSFKAHYIKLISDNVLQGDIRLCNVTATYRPDLPPVLQDLNLSIEAGTKVGICGRTGSGKSSLLLTLLRLNFILSGEIYLDEINLTQIDVEIARRLITIIPQEPYLFSGTLRYNLDPFSIYSDDQILQALEQAHIASVLYRNGSVVGTDSNGNAESDPSLNQSSTLPKLSPAELKGKLNLAVDEHGDNFSIGEKQLISLSRAILNHSKVILMDEVTANIDYVTDGLLQNTLRTSPALQKCTIITIAHRLRTIADYDRIIVMEKGKVVEDNTPAHLLQVKDSFFRKLAEQTGELEEIMKIAERQRSQD